VPPKKKRHFSPIKTAFFPELRPDFVAAVGLKSAGIKEKE
jgi:hypothetical protein